MAKSNIRREAVTHKVRDTNRVTGYRVFLAAPMSSMAKGEYSRSREVVLRLVKRLEADLGVRSVFYAGKDLKSSSQFEDEALALQADLGGIRECDVFVMLYPKKVASSVLVEAGYAYALMKPTVILVRAKRHLPYLFHRAESEDFSETLAPPVRIVEYRSEADLLERAIEAVGEIPTASEKLAREEAELYRLAKELGRTVLSADAAVYQHPRLDYLESIGKEVCRADPSGCSNAKCWKHITATACSNCGFQAIFDGQRFRCRNCGDHRDYPEPGSRSAQM